MTRRYLGDRHTVRFGESLYAVKTVLKTTEVDDARPTMIIQHSAEPVADLGPLRKDRDDLRPGRGPVKQHKFISVVIRCHNAEKRIPHFLAAVDTHFDERFDAYEIVVVDDASTRPRRPTSSRRSPRRCTAR